MIESGDMTVSTTPKAPDTDPSGWLLEVIREHYASVYRLALSSLDDIQAARKVAIFTFAEFWLQETRHPGSNPDRRLYEQAIKNLHRKEIAHPPVTAGPDQKEPASSWMLEPAIEKFNQAVDRLGTIEHYLLVMVYVFGWRPDQAGALLDVGESAALAQFLFHSRLCPLLDKAPESAIPLIGNLPKLPNELVASADHRAAAILQARWPAPVLDEAESEALTRQIEELAESMRQQ
jgi:DNA-directed RNA polymerase specialized sigma24 family protein